MKIKSDMCVECPVYLNGLPSICPCEFCGEYHKKEKVKKNSKKLRVKSE